MERVRMDVRGAVRRFLAENFVFYDEDQIGDEDSFLEFGVVDSTGVLELVMFVEEQFGLTVPDEDVIPEHFDSVASLVSYIERRLGEETLS